jgi:predicted transcriptional regulator
MDKNQISEKLAAEIAQKAGVSPQDAGKILKTLGIDGLVANVGDAGADVARLGVGQLKLAARLGRGGICV